VVTVLLNPASGTRHERDTPARIAALFHAAGVPVRIVVLTLTTDAASVAGAAAEAGADAVVAAGGDGTVSSIAAVLLETNTPLGVLPLGTLNHFARDLEIPLDLERAVATIAARHVVSVDMGEVNNRVFVNNSSIGIYPDIVMEREALRRQGHRKWTALVIACAKILRHHRGTIVTITSGDSIRTVRTPFLFVGNNEYDVDGLRLGGRARLDAGRLFVYLAPRLHAADLPKLLALAVTRRARDGEALESFSAGELQVETPRHRRLRVALDGEVALMTTPLRYRMRAAALRVLVPPR
jgi:diacylglycerol kinase family enzyme